MNQSRRARLRERCCNTLVSTKRDIKSGSAGDGAYPLGQVSSGVQRETPEKEQNRQMAQATPTRRYSRLGLPKGMLVAWQGPGQRTVSRVSTLGLGGIFISTPFPPPVGSVVRLLFEVPNGEVRARAVVRSSEAGRGMGVEFTAMSLDARARLHKLLKRLLR